MTRRHHFASPPAGPCSEPRWAPRCACPSSRCRRRPTPSPQQQKSTAQKVAQAGVPLSELAPNAPDKYTVKPGDTLWDISALFLKSPWRWPELWGMNLEQIRNPHLIYPGQVLFLEKADGRARLRVGQPVGAAPDKTTRLSPRVRAGALGSALASVPLSLIEPFMNEAVIFETDELQTAPRIVATPEGSVLLSRGDLAYARGELGPQREYRIFREARPMTDPTSGELLGFEASFVGTAEYTRPAETRTRADGKAADRPGDPPRHQRAPGGGRRRPPGAGAAARVHELRAARAAAADLRADRLDLWRRPERGAEPDRRAQPRRRRRRRARPRARAVARRQCSWSTGPTRRADDEAARRAPGHAVRLSRLQAHVVCADPQRVRPGQARRPLQRNPERRTAGPRVAWGPPGDRARRTGGLAAAARDAAGRPRGGAPTCSPASARRRRLFEASAGRFAREWPGTWRGRCRCRRQTLEPLLETTLAMAGGGRAACRGHAGRRALSGGAARDSRPAAAALPAGSRRAAGGGLGGGGRQPQPDRARASTTPVRLRGI